MNHLAKVILFNLLIYTLSQACTDPNFSIHTMSSLTKRTWKVESAKNQQLVLKIRGNQKPSGYNWAMDNLTSANKKFLVPVNIDSKGITHEFIPDLTPSNPNATGDGYFYFRFNAKKRGTTKVKFSIKNDEIFKTLTVTVTIT
jgi:hypothetical protein